MCAAANLGYGLHVKSIDRNYILVKNYISLINVIYIQLKKHVKFACCLVDDEIPSFVILDSHKGIHKHNSRMQVSYSSDFLFTLHLTLLFSTTELNKSFTYVYERTFFFDDLALETMAINHLHYNTFCSQIYS